MPSSPVPPAEPSPESASATGDEPGPATPWGNFQPEEALQRARRELRALGLRERAGGNAQQGYQWEKSGMALARLRVDGATLAAAVVRRPSQSSADWQTRTLRHSADLRDHLAALKRQLSAWGLDRGASDD